MNLLLLNQNWFSAEWRAAGHSVVSCGRYPYLDVQIPDGVSNIHSVLKNYLGGFEPDRIVIFDDSSPITFFGLNELPIPQFFYSVDTHHHYERHRELWGGVDAMWTAQADYLDYLQAHGATIGWMPLWASSIYEPSVEKDYDACFVGTLNPALNPRRVDFFNRLQACAPITVLTGSFESIFPKSHIVVNQTVKQDLNFRVFEAMMSGSLLITERIGNRLFTIFAEEQHLVTYAPDDHREAAEKIQYYRAQPELARRIGEAGRAEILRAHLPLHRAATLEDALRPLSYQPGPQRHLSMMVNHVLLAAARRTDPPNLGQIEALAAGAVALEQAIRAEEVMSLTQAALAAVGCLEFDAIQRSTAGFRLLERAAEVWGSCAVLHFVRIWQLLKSGDREGARVWAERSFAEETEVVFERARELVDLIIRTYSDPRLFG